MVTKDDIIMEVLSKYPQTMGIFMLHGIDACSGGDKTIEQGAKDGGADVEGVVAAINSTI